MAQLRFRSRSEHSLDSKGRLNIPSRFREVLREVYSENLVITNWDRCLRAYPVSEWDILEEKLSSDEAQAQADINDFVRYVISGVTECSLDKQGRILLPQMLRSEFNIEKDVVLNGMLNYFEIWDRGAWAEQARVTRARFTDFEPGMSALKIR
ncbi:MAG: division/cell wall cluster transcriptional repressor MraZ [Desulfobulbus propionicus]|nr:MAG: division/cell wall cluster transcriptional repressor MraZ [Desulfobulbus propionicus]